MTEPRPLNLTPVEEVPLREAPLERVIAQVRFPPILAIRNPDKAAVMQEALRATYPHLNQDHVQGVEISGDQTPNVRQELIWRLADRETNPDWRVSLGVNFIALETSAYDNRADFLDRLHSVVSTLEHAFSPASANRFGLRYIDRLTDEAFDHIHELIRPEVLGILCTSEDSRPSLRESVFHLLTDAQFQAQNGAKIQGRWGKLPENATYDPNALEPVPGPSWVLDLDMFTTESRAFSGEELVKTARDYAECLYGLFREMVTMEFLAYHGGKP